MKCNNVFCYNYDKKYDLCCSQFLHYADNNVLDTCYERKQFDKFKKEINYQKYIGLDVPFSFLKFWFKKIKNEKSKYYEKLLEKIQ